MGILGLCERHKKARSVGYIILLRINSLVDLAVAVCLSVCLSVRPSVRPSVCLSARLSVQLNINISAIIRAENTKFGIKVPQYQQLLKFLSIIECHAHCPCLE